MDTVGSYLEELVSRGITTLLIGASENWPLKIKSEDGMAYFLYGPDYPQDKTLYLDQVL